MKTSIFRLLLALTLLLIVTQLPTRAAPTMPAANPFAQEHTLAGIGDVVSVSVQQPEQLITRSQANASVTGCAALTYRVLLPLIVRSSSSAMVLTGANPLQPDRAMPADSAGTAMPLTVGQRPGQIGLLDGVIDPQRAAVLRGQVCDRNGKAIGGAQITVLNHAEYGSTLTGADGVFDLTVNGGGLITIVYTRTGYLPSQRQVQAPWQDYAWLPDIVLLPLDAQVTTINLNTAGMQVARGSTSSDVDGSRRATLLIPQSTQAELVLPNGLTQTVTTLHVRATEYTVGKSGPLAMPAQMPSSRGYTYALEYSVDEGL
ncbi:MAG: carboxypeptidase regulatory-like domain-containing protein, partial [Chloroflexi bacterium]|nr:carboxypeptidase regulatory-like domain-containing protein [Chloroflexota bacterium]